MGTVRTRRQTATPAENGARQMFRALGYQVEAISWVRSKDGEFMAVKCWPATDTADLVELLLSPRNHYLQITRIHLGRDNGLNNGNVTARVYLRWADEN